ncbi:hypothetical protein GW17_00033139 [Ensete ventricosum]|nr:hypothetical protein GW17_00033139 [Ensete ventricosum]
MCCDHPRKPITLGQLFNCIDDAHDIAESDGYASSEHHILKLDDFAPESGANNHLAFLIHLYHPHMHQSLIYMKMHQKLSPPLGLLGHHNPQADANQDSRGANDRKSITLSQLFKHVNGAHSNNIVDAKSDDYPFLEHHVLELDDFAPKGGAGNHLAFCLHPFRSRLHRSCV